VAVKVLSPKSARWLDRCAVEARAVARVQHPNVLQIFDVGECGRTPSLVLELVEGGSLDDRGELFFARPV
jgi:serine/threonine-protein kinase